jgi:hypothetical protein
MIQTNVPVVFLDPGINGTAGLPNVNLTTFAGYAVHAWFIVSHLCSFYSFPIHSPEFSALVAAETPSSEAGRN